MPDYIQYYLRLMVPINQSLLKKEIKYLAVHKSIHFAGLINVGLNVYRRLGVERHRGGSSRR